MKASPFARPRGGAGKHHCPSRLLSAVFAFFFLAGALPADAYADDAAVAIDKSNTPSGVVVWASADKAGEELTRAALAACRVEIGSDNVRLELRPAGLPKDPPKLAEWLAGYAAQLDVVLIVDTDVRRAGRTSRGQVRVFSSSGTLLLDETRRLSRARRGAQIEELGRAVAAACRLQRPPFPVAPVAGSEQASGGSAAGSNQSSVSQVPHPSDVVMGRGSWQLSPRTDAYFVDLGYYNAGGLLGRHYLRLAPRVAWHTQVLGDRHLRVQVVAPFDILVAKGNASHTPLSWRRKAYDEVAELLAILERVELGQPGDQVFVQAGLLPAIELGRGASVRRYNPNVDVERPRPGLFFDTHNDALRVQGFVADVTMSSPVLGVAGSVRPWSLFGKRAAANGPSLELHLAADLNAPQRLLTNGQTGLARRVLVDERGRPRYLGAPVAVFGLTAEALALRKELFELSVYGDLSRIGGGGGGLLAGGALSAHLAKGAHLHRLQAQLELRAYSNDFVPSYFDGNYEVSRFQAAIVGGVPQSKLEHVVLAPPSPWHMSVYADLTYALVDYVVVEAALARVLEADGTYDLMLGVEVPFWEHLRFAASYEKFGFTQLGRAFATATRTAAFESGVVLSAKLRWMVLPVLFLTFAARQTDRFNPLYFGGAYTPHLDWLVQLEVGYERH